MTKLIIQIPCFNEEETLPRTLTDLPQRVAGCDSIEVLVVDDGCTDRTVEVARQAGVRQFLRLPRNRGLAAAFAAGMSRALELGADVIVNTDGWVDDEDAVRYKLTLAKRIKPSVLIGIQEQSELTFLLGALPEVQSVAVESWPGSAGIFPPAAPSRDSPAASP